MLGRTEVVAVVDARDDSVIVWWVNVGARPSSQRAQETSRLCGAWKVSSPDSAILDTLTFDRMLLPTKAGRASLETAGVNIRRLLDLPKSISLITKDRDRHRAIFEDEQARRVKSKQLRAPDWPEFPNPLDVEHPPHETGLAGTDESVARALAIAHWLSQLCSQWEYFEEMRLASSWLAKIAGTEVRGLPVVLQR